MKESICVYAVTCSIYTSSSLQIHIHTPTYNFSPKTKEPKLRKCMFYIIFICIFTRYIKTYKYNTYIYTT